MNKEITLSKDDRNFLTLVAKAAFTNPFSRARGEVDALIAGMEDLSGEEERERLQFIMPRLKKRLNRLEGEGKDKIRLYAGEDHQCIKYAWLFYFFHCYVDRMDGLIQTQLAAGDKPCTVPFARDLLHDLRQRGFRKDEALRFLALFYQLRRAFYFIDKGLVGRSPPMRALRRSLWNNIFTHDITLFEEHLWNRLEDFSTVLLGETGTGKGTAAAAIGRSGYIPFNEGKCAFEESFMRTFISINLSQYPESLIESELFGHRKGAFTGAVENHDGIFLRSSPHGALLLDEIGEVSIPVQIKLLQVLQERTFSPVGSHETRRFNGRVIAATNLPLEKLRSSGRFRDDFFYRLSSDIITVPPLRERLAEDMGELDDLLSLMVNRTVGKPSPDLGARIRETLDRDLPPHYAWPGNVREVEQAVRRVLLTGHYQGEATPASSDGQADLLNAMAAGTLTARELMGRYCTLLYERHGNYGEVARRTELDRRTVKKHIDLEDRG